MSLPIERNEDPSVVDPRSQSPSVSRHEINPQNAVNLMPLPISEARPAFVPSGEIERWAERIGEDVRPHIMGGVKRFVQREGLNEASLATSDRRAAWLWAVKASKYNAIYFTSRREAKKNLGFVREHADEIDAIGRFIDGHGGVAPIANYAIHNYVGDFADAPEKQVITSNKSIPKTAVQGYDDTTIVVKPGHFLDEDPQTSFDTPDEIHDWHDLAHVVAASSSKGFFGVKYHDGLNDLDRYYRQLTQGVGMQDGTGPVFSDGLLFTQLSRPLFEFYQGQRLADGTPIYSPEQIQRLITLDLFAYLGGDYALLHPGTGKGMEAGRPIDPLELAVCEQNKRYERRAAEVETHLFVRGTPEGSRGEPDKDPLVGLSRSQRIEQIAELRDDRLYFESRNLIRHRAHEDALGQFAGYLLNSRRQDLARAGSDEERARLSDEVQLLQATVDFYQMNDLRDGREINLYQHVGNLTGTPDK